MCCGVHAVAHFFFVVFLLRRVLQYIGFRWSIAFLRIDGRFILQRWALFGYLWEVVGVLSFDGSLEGFLRSVSRFGLVAPLLRVGLNSLSMPLVALVKYPF